MKKYFLALLLCLFMSFSANANLDNLETQMQFFYQKKNMITARAIIQEISDQKILDKQPTFQASLFGFITGLVIEHPQYLEQFKSMNLDPKTHQVILNVEKSVKYTMGNIDMYANPDEIWNPVDLDSLWGMFFATGNEKIPEAIREFIEDRNKLHQDNVINIPVMAAEWSLKSIAKEHPIVKKSLDKLQKANTPSQRKTQHQKKNNNMGTHPIF